MPLKIAELAAGSGSRVPDERHAGRADGSSVTFPILVRQWPKSTRETLRVSLDRFHDRAVIDVRVWWWGETGELRPGKSGLTVSTRHVRQLADALAEAAKQAEERGLIDGRTER